MTYSIKAYRTENHKGFTDSRIFKTLTGARKHAEKEFKGYFKVEIVDGSGKVIETV